MPDIERDPFDYAAAFSRNIGWVTEGEQERLRTSCVAIAGMGGVGGAHLMTLARLGVGRFHIADFDRFEIQNFNRQVGAFVSTVGQPKVDVMSRLALDTNPTARIETFPSGVQAHNLDEFLRGVDVFVDGIDFFELSVRRALFSACREMKIPALTAAPLGMGVALLYFSPDGMSFEDYFRFEGTSSQEQYARFIAGLSPAMLQRHYLAVPDAVDFARRSGPSMPMACELCAGVMGTAVLKLLTGRGLLKPAPWAMQFDAYRQQLRFTWRPGGNANPLQWLLLKLIRPRLRMAASA
jgi:molybdopterin/thiamine biosynthesis adenylyltransferase